MLANRTGPSRRDFLWRSGGGLGGVALACLLAEDRAFADTLKSRAELNGGLHHRAKAQLPCPLCDSGQKHTRRRRIAEWRVVVLGQVIPIKAGAVIRLDQLQAFLEMPGERLAAVV